MTEIDFDDPKLQRIVRSVAARFVRPGLDIEDLIADGYLGLLSPRREFDAGTCTREHWIWQEAYEAIRAPFRRVESHTTPARMECDVPHRESPEPSPELVRLFGVLTDDEAETLCLSCGMDGSAERGYDLVAHIVGAGRSSVARRYKSAVCKLRRTIEAMQQAERLRA